MKNQSEAPLFKTKYNGIGKLKPEINDEASLLVVGQSYTIRELMEKFTRGIAPAITKLGYGTEDPSFDDIDETQLPDYDISEAKQTINEYYSEQKSKKRLAEKLLKEASDITKQKSESVTDEGGAATS